jgi:phosphatidylserine/phosphatidylglycerophosphate/cardiolipin synthase-like enzyme
LDQPPAPEQRSPLHAPGAAWRIARAERVSFLIDSAVYFAAAMAAMRKARHSILLLGWSFDPRTRLRPRPEDAEDAPDEIGNVLRTLARRRPQLDIRVLIWKSALPISATQQFFPHRAQAWFVGSRVKFRLDASIPYGACHHQKVLVIDDVIAFCGGDDFSIDRWDTPAHLDEEPRRDQPRGFRHPPRHETMMMMDGAAARAIGDLARERWRRATGAGPLTPPAEERSDLWPDWLPPDVRGADVAIARTEPAWRGQPEVNEVELLHLACIRAARRSIYFENQYFASPVICEALASRLAEDDGPEVVLVTTEHSASYFDRLTMDRTRADLLRRLRAADRHKRFRAYFPRTAKGKAIIVHSKVAVIDNRILRIGSANLNNRSGGFDTECDSAIEASGSMDETAIAQFRARLIGHFTDVAPGDVETLTLKHGLVGALDRLTSESGARLAPLEPERSGPLAALIAAYHIGDPLDASDSWRPLRRRRRLVREMAGLLAAPKSDSAPPGD